MPSKSSRRMMAPVGLLGYGRMSSLVFGVIFSLSSWGVRRNWFSAFVSMITGVPPAKRVIGS